MIEITKVPKVGRPKIVLDSKQIKEVESLAKNLTLGQVAASLSMSESAFCDVRNRQPEVMESFRRGKTKSINYVVSQLMQKISEGDTAATIFFLKTQAGWSEKQKIDVNANISGQLPRIILETRNK